MKYIKKPVIVDAIQWDGKLSDVVKSGYTGYFIETLEGRMLISPGDYIITGVEGEHYPCKPGIFEKTYEKVEQ